VKKVNGKYLSTIEANESTDYNVSIVDNFYFLQYIVCCLKGEISHDKILITIKEIESQMNDIKETIKLKQGEEGYTGLMIKT